MTDVPEDDRIGANDSPEDRKLKAIIAAMGAPAGAVVDSGTAARMDELIDAELDSVKVDPAGDSTLREFFRHYVECVPDPAADPVERERRVRAIIDEVNRQA